MKTAKNIEVTIGINKIFISHRMIEDVFTIYQNESLFFIESRKGFFLNDIKTIEEALKIAKDQIHAYFISRNQKAPFGFYTSDDFVKRKLSQIYKASQCTDINDFDQAIKDVNEALTVYPDDKRLIQRKVQLQIKKEALKQKLHKLNQVQ